MLFKQIKYFLTIADTGSFTEAAAQCFISQSAVSQQINALEAELGVTLFERTPRRVFLTAAGRYLYENGKKVIRSSEKLKQGVIAAANKSSERLSVAYATGCVSENLPQALCIFKKQHANVAVDVYGTGYITAFSDLAHGRTDLVLAGRLLQPGDDYETCFLGSKPVFAGISSVFSDKVHEYVTADDLKELPCIIVAEHDEREAAQCYYRKFWGVKNSFLTAASEEEAELMAAAGNGFMLTDNYKVRPGIQKVPFYAGASRAEKKYYLYTSKGSDRYVQDFIQIMSGLCAEAQQPGEDVE